MMQPLINRPSMQKVVDIPPAAREVLIKIYKIQIAKIQSLWILLICLIKYNIKRQVKIDLSNQSHQSLDIRIYVTLQQDHQPLLSELIPFINSFNIIMQESSIVPSQDVKYHTIQSLCQRLLFRCQKRVILDLSGCNSRERQFIISQIEVFRSINITSQVFLNQEIILSSCHGYYEESFDQQEVRTDGDEQNRYEKFVYTNSCLVDLLDHKGKALDDNNKDLLIAMIEKIDPVNIKGVQFCCQIVKHSINCYIQITFKKTEHEISFINQLKNKIKEICIKISKHNYQQQSYAGNASQNGQSGVIYNDRLQLQNLVNSIYKNCDINILRTAWNQFLRKFLIELNKEWSIYKFQYEWSIRKLIQYLEYTLEKYKYRVPTEKNKKEDYANAKYFNVLDIVCPEMATIVEIFQRKLSMVSIKIRINKRISQKYRDYEKKKQNESNETAIIYRGSIERQIIQECLQEREEELKIQKNLVDKLIYSYFKDIEERNSNVQNGKPKFFYISTKNGSKIALGKFISEFIVFQGNSKQWADIFMLIDTNLRQAKGKRLLEVNYANGLEYERLPNTNCLGCTQFFYSEADINNENDVNVETRVFDFVQRLGDYEVKIKQEICYLLNNNGGILLFDCVRQCNSIFPKGALITQKDKEMIQNKINSWMTSIYPKIQIKRNITLSFVPVYLNAHFFNKKPQSSTLQAYSGEQTLKKPNQFHYRQALQEGVYVFRIKVTPHDQKLYYFWETIENNHHHYFIYEPKSEERYLFKDIRKLIKKKEKKFREMYHSSQAFLIPNALNPLNHVCCEPEAGVMIKKKPTSEVSFTQRPQAQNKELKYKYMSLAFTRPHNMQKVKKKLQSKKFLCPYEQKFTNQNKYKLKAAMYTSILYHNQKFETLFSLVNNNIDFYYDGKPLILIFITNYIRIQNQDNFNKEQFDTLCNWMKLEFPMEKLQLFQFKSKGRNELFFRSQTKTSTVLLYFLLKQANYKVTLKNPLHIDRLKPEELALVWRKIYSNDQQSNRRTTRDKENLSLNHIQIKSESHKISYPQVGHEWQYNQNQANLFDDDVLRKLFDQLQDDGYETYYQDNMLQSQ